MCVCVSVCLCVCVFCLVGCETRKKVMKMEEEILKEVGNRIMDYM